MVIRDSTEAIKLLKLWANEIARKLYASLGFEETGEMDGDEIVAVLKL